MGGLNPGGGCGAREVAVELAAAELVVAEKAVAGPEAGQQDLHGTGGRK